MLLPPVQLATCSHPAALHTVPPTTAADSRPKGCGRSRRRAIEWVVDTAPPPAHMAELAVAVRATHERRERRIRGGNRRGAERRRLRGQVILQAGAAIAPMLCEDETGTARQPPGSDRSRATRRPRARSAG